MKRIIALILCLILMVSLCACGKSDGAADAGSTVQGGFYIEYKNTSAGYINHTSESASSVMKSDTFESTDDFYIYLPEGSTLSSSKNFSVYCYNQHFVLDTALTKACGQNLLRFSVQISNSTKTISADCYVRIAVEGKLTDVVIDVPSGKEQLVITGSKDDLLYGPQINEIAQLVRDKENMVNYIFITDLHYDSDPTAQKSEALLKQVKAAVKMANTLDSIDFIVIGGDTTSGMYEKKADALKYTAEVLEPLKESKKPVFVITGNHDDNSYHSFHTEGFDESAIVSDKDWSDNIIKVFCPENIVKDSKYQDSKYYYYDLADKKTRIICLDAIDYRAKYDQNGNIKELPIKDASETDEESRYWSGTSYWGYSEGQMRWLVNEAMAAPDDWNYMFMSHMGIDVNTQTNYYEPHYGVTLRNIISAFQNRKSAEVGIGSVDFRNVTGNVLTYHFGHTHRELTRYCKDINLWQLNTQTAQVSTDAEVIGDPTTTNDSKGNDWVVYDRQYGSDYEACFDIVCADSNIIYKYAFGAGTDEVLKYK
ncbi:MAG: metallophosphoesterase [Clostridia bacterium]|nr:metallophosphoesterase [Clostridia bacterium]